MKVISEITGLEYNPNNVVRILNTQQIAMYLKHGAKLIDLYASVKKDGTPVLVCIFNREDTKELYELWCKRELK